MDADTGYGRTRPKRGLSARFHDSFRNPLGETNPHDAAPVRHRYSLSDNLLLCGNRKMMCPIRSPREPLPRKPFVSPSPRRKKLNTGRNASNSRFFSDCYSALIWANCLFDKDKFPSPGDRHNRLDALAATAKACPAKLRRIKALNGTGRHLRYRPVVCKEARSC